MQVLTEIRYNGYRNFWEYNTCFQRENVGSVQHHRAQEGQTHLPRVQCMLITVSTCWNCTSFHSIGTNWELACLSVRFVTCTGTSAVKTTREVTPEDPPWQCSCSFCSVCSNFWTVMQHPPCCSDSHLNYPESAQLKSVFIQPMQPYCNNPHFISNPPRHYHLNTRQPGTHHRCHTLCHKSKTTECFRGSNGLHQMHSA